MLSSAYLDAYTMDANNTFIPNRSAFTFNTLQAAAGITASGTNNNTFIVTSAGTYNVTIDAAPFGVVQLRVNGANVGPEEDLSSCQNTFLCSFSRIVTLAAGDAITLININGSIETDFTDTAITIIRIA